MALHGDSDTAPDVSAAPSCISGRFDVEALIARGGMAWVYRVRDRSTGQALALKWLDTSGSAEHVSRMTALLEREYQTLKQSSRATTTGFTSSTLITPWSCSTAETCASSPRFRGKKCVESLTTCVRRCRCCIHGD